MGHPYCLECGLQIRTEIKRSRRGFSAASGCQKSIFKSRKGSGNEAFPDWNPQSRLCLFEEKGEFQGFLWFFRKLME